MNFGSLIESWYHESLESMVQGSKPPFIEPNKIISSTSKRQKMQLLIKMECHSATFFEIQIISKEFYRTSYLHPFMFVPCVNYVKAIKCWIDARFLIIYVLQHVHMTSSSWFLIIHSVHDFDETRKENYFLIYFYMLSSFYYLTRHSSFLIFKCKCNATSCRSFIF